jgi:hypothetical protein
MENTYTYTARSAEDPDRIVTFTLHGNRMSVGVGAPLEQVEQVIRASREVPSEEESVEAERPTLWLKPLAVSLAERGTRALHVSDVDADVDGDELWVRGWIRTGGLRLFPLTLTGGRVDNPDAARAFVAELEERKESSGAQLGMFGFFDYWASWVALGIFVLGFFRFWRRRMQGEEV